MITAVMTVALTTPTVANAMVLYGLGPTGATRHANTVSSKQSRRVATMVGSFANIPGFNIAVESSIGFSRPR
jgi:hypothetical protein